ncbi:hypothetical protein ACHWQZ_G019058 [Mnemiopsis leidyi]
MRFHHVMFVLFFAGNLMKGTQAGADHAEEYYCPLDETLIEKNCYKAMKSDINVMNKVDADKHCKSMNKVLPDSTLSQTPFSGWLQDLSSTRGEVSDSYCIYSHPTPRDIISPNKLSFNIAPCSGKLPVLCAKQLPTGSSCEEGWSTVVRDTFKYCVKPSDKTSGAGEYFEKNLCLQGSSLFSFNYANPENNLSYEGHDDNLLQPFWTPFYIDGTKTVHWETKKEARAFSACLYKTGKLHVSLVSCGSLKQFHCQSAAKEVPHKDTVQPDPYDPEQDYSCDNEGEVLCKSTCYKHWRTYKNQADAAKNCTAVGAKLTSQTVPCIQYVTGWVNGSFENGAVTTSSHLTLTAEHCVHVYEGAAKLADCRLRAHALYAVQLEEGEETCPDSYHKCGDKSVCVGSSSDTLTWGAAVGNVPRDRRRLLQTRSMLEDCTETLRSKLTAPHWIAARISKGGVVEFNNGAIKSEKQCLKMQGGKLMTVDCNAMMYYTCERPAVVSATNTSIIAVLIVGPAIILGVILFLLYRKKGKDMCLSRNTASGVDLANTGMTVTNPLAEVEPETDIKSTENEVKSSQDLENLYSEVEI